MIHNILLINLEDTMCIYKIKVRVAPLKHGHKAQLTTLAKENKVKYANGDKFRLYTTDNKKSAMRIITKLTLIQEELDDFIFGIRIERPTK
jgi:uncharacterized protein YaiL (DUF2058 family)